MADKNKIQLLAGLIMVIISFLCVVAVFFFLGQDQRYKQEEIAAMEAQVSNLINEKAESQMTQDDHQRAKGQTIDVIDFVARKQNLYSEEELNRREGILWIDRQTGHFIITLGIVHGLEQGEYLDVMENNNVIARLRVDSPLDVISYTSPVAQAMNDFQGNYYRVAIKN